MIGTDAAGIVKEESGVDLANGTIGSNGSSNGISSGTRQSVTVVVKKELVASPDSTTAATGCVTSNGQPGVSSPVSNGDSQDNAVVKSMDKVVDCTESIKNEATGTNHSTTTSTGVDGNSGSRNNGASRSSVDKSAAGDGSGAATGGTGNVGTPATVKKSGSGTTGGARSKTGHSLTQQHSGARGAGGGGHYHHQQHAHGQVPRASFEFPLRILVSSDSVGAIIGKSGGTIKQITQESRARVDVLRKDAPHHHPQQAHHQNPDKEIAIYGPPESCSTALQKIMEICETEGTKNEGHQEWRSGGSNTDEVTLRMLAHNSLVGRIIGKNGVTVKKVMESSGTKISVSSSIHDSDRNLFAADRIITIRGSTIADVISAESAISAKLRASFENDQINMTLPPPMYQGFPPHGPHPGMVGPPPPPFHPQGTGGGRHQPGRPGMYPQFVHPPPPMGFPGGHPIGFPGHPHLPGLPGYGLETDAKETAVMFVPQAAVGAIIGTGGATIREMILQSGANIKVAQPPKQSKQQQSKSEDAAAGGDTEEKSPSPSSRRSSEQAPAVSVLSASLLVDHRKVTITGTPDAQWKAQYAIFRKVSFETPGVGPIVDANLVVEITVPSSQVGRIIGKSGQTVRELQRMTRAQIKLPEEGTTTGSETPVQITGDFFACQGAQRQIRSLVQRGLLPMSGYPEVNLGHYGHGPPTGGNNRNPRSKSNVSGAKSGSKPKVDKTEPKGAPSAPEEGAASVESLPSSTNNPSSAQ